MYHINGLRATSGPDSVAVGSTEAVGHLLTHIDPLPPGDPTELVGRDLDA